MNLSAPFILRPVMTTLLMITVFFLGLAAFREIPVSNMPDVNYPTITVSVGFPGANPATMAKTVATPLEKQFMAIPGIRYVTSSSTLGATSIILEFDITKNIDLAAVDVEAAIVAAKPNLPPNLPQDPVFKKVNPSSSPVVYVTITSSSLQPAELYNYGGTVIGQRLAIIDGVAQVSVYGSPFAVRAQVDPALVASLGLTLSEVGDAMRRENQYQPLGQFDGDVTAPIIYDTGGLLNAEQFGPIAVVYRNGFPVRLESLGGKVLDSLQKDRSQRRFIDKNRDQPAVTLAIQRQPGANVVKVAEAVDAVLEELRGQLPGALELELVFDRSLSVREAVHDVELTLLIAFVLVVLVIYLYLGSFRETVIPSIVMPMSIIATIMIIYQMGYTLDSLSLLAFTLAIGFIIDDAIVVLENIVRRIEEGESPQQATLEGSKQIGFTIVSMTLSLIAVFIPLIFMSGLIGKLFQEFAMTLTIVTLVSGVLSLTLTPMLCSLFLQSSRKAGGMRRVSERYNAWMLRGYERALRWVFAHRWVPLLAGALSIVLSFYLLRHLPTDFIPDEDIGFVIAYTEAEQGTSSDKMNEYQSQVIDILRREPSIEMLVSNSATPQYRQGLIFCTLVPANERKPVGELIQDWNQKMKAIPGVNVFLKNIPLIDLNVGSQVRGAYQYLMQSLYAEELYPAAQALIDKMRADPIFQSISTDLEIKTPQLTLDILRDQAAALGIDAQNLENALVSGFSGNRVSRIQTSIDQYDVILELNRDLQRTTNSLNSLYLRSRTTNQLVPLPAVANWTEGVGPASVNHFAQFPAVTITFNIDSEVPLSIGLQRLRELAAASFTPNVTGNVRGSAQSFEESVQSLTVLFIVTIFVIYIVLGILYESFIHPITILSTLPPAIVGAFLTLVILNKPLSLYALLGLILLIGIVKKNGIMIVDFALENVRHKGESPEQSVLDACLVRFRPIMMTTIAAIMGAVPIAIGMGAGADARRPLGWVIIGGMLVSQLITLFLTPIVYIYMERLRERFSHSKEQIRKH